MMDRVLCSRAREVGGCRHVELPEEPAGRIPRLWSQAKANILVEL